MSCKSNCTSCESSCSKEVPKDYNVVTLNEGFNIEKTEGVSIVTIEESLPINLSDPSIVGTRQCITIPSFDRIEITDENGYIISGDSVIISITKSLNEVFALVKSESNIILIRTDKETVSFISEKTEEYNGDLTFNIENKFESGESYYIGNVMYKSNPLDPYTALYSFKHESIEIITARCIAALSEITSIKNALFKIDRKIYKYCAIADDLFSIDDITYAGILVTNMSTETKSIIQFNSIQRGNIAFMEEGESYFYDKELYTFENGNVTFSTLHNPEIISDIYGVILAISNPEYVGLPNVSGPELYGAISEEFDDIKTDMYAILENRSKIHYITKHGIISHIDEELLSQISEELSSILGNANSNVVELNLDNTED